MNCTECKGTGSVKAVCDDPLGQQTFNVSCFACVGTGLGTTVRCIMCEKEEPRRHPGQFMCGNPECRREIVKIVAIAKMKQRMIEPEMGAPPRFPTDEERAATEEKSVAETLAAAARGSIADAFKIPSKFVMEGLVSKRKVGDFVFIPIAKGYVTRVRLTLHANGFGGRPKWDCLRDDNQVQFLDVFESEMYDTKEAAEAAMNAGTVLT